MRNLIAYGVVATLVLAPAGVQSQESEHTGLALGSIPVTLTLKSGTSRLGGGGDVFHVFRRDLSLSESAFDSGVLEMELAATLTPRADVFVGGAIRSARQAVTRAWEHVDGFEAAEQTTRLAVTPGLHTGARFFAFERPTEGVGRTGWSANPYLTLGVGRGSYELRQWGRFVDRATEEGFGATFVAHDRYYRAFFGVGGDFAVAPGLSVVLEARRDFASPRPGGDFHGFYDLSLSGSTLMLGLSWR